MFLVPSVLEVRALAAQMSTTAIMLAVVLALTVESALLGVEMFSLLGQLALPSTLPSIVDTAISVTHTLLYALLEAQ
jgi:hypothetical protein